MAMSSWPMLYTQKIPSLLWSMNEKSFKIDPIPAILSETEIVFCISIAESPAGTSRLLFDQKRTYTGQFTKKKSPRQAYKHRAVIPI